MDIAIITVCASWTVSIMSGPNSASYLSHNCVYPSMHNKLEGGLTTTSSSMVEMVSVDET